MRKLLSFITVLALLITILPAQNTYAAETSAPKITTPAQYVEYLKTQPNSAASVAQFNSLSAADQQKYVSYVTDSELMKQVFDATLSGKPTVLKGGDIKINQNHIGLPPTTGGSIGTLETVRNVQHDFESIILGMNAFTYRVTLTYSVGGTSNANLQVKKAISGNGVLLFSRIPGLSMSFTKDFPYVTNNTAVFRVNCVWDLAYSGSGASFGTDIVTMKGFPDGTMQYSVERV